MGKTALPNRIIIDSFAIVKLHQMLGDSFSGLLYNMMYVNYNSLQHKKNHIVTSQKSFDIMFDYLIGKIDPEKVESLSASIRPQSIQSIEEIAEETERTWEYAVFISSDRPFQTIIITDKTNKDKYNAHKTADNKQNIQINDEDTAKTLIDTYFALCRLDKQD